MSYWNSSKALNPDNLNEFGEVIASSGDSLPVGTEVDYDGSASNIPIGWEEVTNPNVYSTTEKFTGKYWIDGKKIYRKVLTADSLTYSNQIATIPTNITNIDNLINFKGTLYDSDHGWYSLPYVTHLNYQWTVGYELDNKNYSTPTILIRNYAYGDARFSKYIFILEYTKTTY